MEITSYNSVNINKLMSNLDTYKYNPSMIQRIILDHLDEITNGEVNIVDPTNPFVFLLEASSVNTSLAISENLINLRKQYPSLAQNEADLYLHMSDKDFIDRFAVPSNTYFTVVVQVNDLYSKMVYDSVEKCGKVTIARDTEFIIDDIVFTLQYPIDIKRYDNGMVQISYDTEITSPLQTLTTNIIEYNVRRDNDLVDWIFFKIPVSQFSIFTSYLPTQLSSMFSYDILYTDQFYFCRVLYKNASTNNLWKDLIVTHTDQVYDPLKPTAVLVVTAGNLNVSIPKIYFTSGLVSGDIRVDIYTTKGELTINLGNYKFSSFSNKLKAIDEVRDSSDYTNAMINLAYYTYSDQLIAGGTNGIDFNTLRERVLTNSIGVRQLPITNTQLEAFVNDTGFDLIRNVDVITNRIFLATQKLPKPINTKLLTSANIGIGTFITNLSILSTMDKVRINNNRQTILSNNIFQNTNGIISLLSTNDVNQLLARPRSEFLNLVNTNDYLYNPFYYVLDDSTNEFEVRAYNLDYPIASNLSFISQNQSIQLPVNTSQYTLEKITNGFKLTLVTKSGNFYKQLEDGLVNAQLGYYPVGESSLAYINGTQVAKTTDGERMYEFVIETNYDVNKDHNLGITNAKMFSNENVLTWIPLLTTMHMFYTTTSLTTTFIPDTSDSLIGKFLLPDASACVTHETLTVELGSSLSNLWSRSRTYATGLDYQTYPDDVPLLYDKVVYTTDPVTNSIFTIDGTGELVYNILHNIGDPVLDSNSEQVYKHRKGDVILDNNGKPVQIAALSSDKELDILFVDGRYYFTTDKSFIDYKSEIVAILDTWITNDLYQLQQILLEKTNIYFYPKTTIGMVKVYVENNQEDTIPSEQSLIVNLYVPDNVFKDLNIRENLIDLTISTIDSFINGSTINITEIETSLQTLYGNSVKAIDITGLGDKNYKVINLATEHNRLSLHKKLVQQQDNTMIIEEDIEVNFYNADRSLLTSLL